MAPRKRAGTKAGGAFAALSSLSQSGGLAAINGTPAVVEALAVPAQVEDGAVPKAKDAPQPAPVAPAAKPAGDGTGIVPAPTPPHGEHQQHVQKAGDDVPSAPAPAAADTLEPSPEPEALPAEKLAVPTDDQVPARLGLAPTDPAPSPAAPAAPDLSGSVNPTGAIALAAEAAALRPATTPSFRATSGYMQPRQAHGLPPALAQKVDGLPEAYLLLANSYRLARSARPDRPRAKRNMRLNTEVADTMTRQLLRDKRLLGVKDLKPSHYVDAAISYGRQADVATLIDQAHDFRERWIGAEDILEDPNHYSITKENNDWLDEMLDELMIAKANGLHGHMINVILETFLQELTGRTDG